MYRYIYVYTYISTYIYIHKYIYIYVYIYMLRSMRSGVFKTGMHTIANKDRINAEAKTAYMQRQKRPHESRVRG